jgi:hypothetical protein
VNSPRFKDIFRGRHPVVDFAHLDGISAMAFLNDSIHGYRGEQLQLNVRWHPCVITQLNGTFVEIFVHNRNSRGARFSLRYEKTCRSRMYL